MKSKILKMALIFSLVLSVSAVLAQPMGRGKGGFMGGCMGDGSGFGKRAGMMLQKLDLSKDQQEKVDKLMDNHKKEAGSLRDDLQKLMIDKRAMMREDNAKRDAVVDLEKKILDLRGKLALINTNFMLDIGDVLTPEQRKQMQDMGFRGQRHERGGAFFRGNRGDCPFDNN